MPIFAVVGGPERIAGLVERLGPRLHLRGVLDCLFCCTLFFCRQIVGLCIHTPDRMQLRASQIPAKEFALDSDAFRARS